MRKHFVTRKGTMFDSRDDIVKAIYDEPWKSQAEISAVFGKSKSWAGVMLTKTDARTFRQIQTEAIKQLVAEHKEQQEREVG